MYALSPPVICHKCKFSCERAFRKPLCGSPLAVDRVSGIAIWTCESVRNNELLCGSGGIWFKVSNKEFPHADSDNDDGPITVTSPAKEPFTLDFETYGSDGKPRTMSDQLKDNFSILVGTNVNVKA